jgi:hypothetical protein
MLSSKEELTDIGTATLSKQQTSRDHSIDSNTIKPDSS